MRIGIVTHPLGNNYGGLLQAYALQEILKRLGHDAWIFQKNRASLKTVLLRAIRNLLYDLMRKFYVSQKDKRELSSNMLYFAEKYIMPKTPRLPTNWIRSFYLYIKKFDALVVGSDQVWRPTYVGNIGYYFLNFSKNNKIKRISYAASFGVDSWELSPEETKLCMRLLNNFSSVSVREDSGVAMCADFLKHNAQLVLDPTLLLEKEDYIKIIENECQLPNSRGIFAYFLDKSNEYLPFIRKVENATHLEAFTCMPKKTRYEEMNQSNKKQFLFPPVSQWLRSFLDASIVLTDSFHGCVFSIIFNKPFWVIVNKERGAVRFDSLLNMFGLQHRVVSTSNSEHLSWDQPIDWNKVNLIKQEWKDRSLCFLASALQ